MPAFAADSNTNSSASNYGVIVCRVANTGEKANARMMVQDTTLVCKPVDSQVSMQVIGKVKTKSIESMGPQLSDALTPAQIDAAWHQYMDKMFMIPATGP